MGSKYYVIKVFEPSEHTGKRFVGYYTGVYTVNKSNYVGSDQNINYERVIHYKTTLGAENQIKNLRSQQFGGEARYIEYDFEIEEVDSKPEQQSSKNKIPKYLKDDAKDLIKRIIAINLEDEINAYCIDGQLEDNEKELFETAVYSILSKLF